MSKVPKNQLRNKLGIKEYRTPSMKIASLMKKGLELHKQGKFREASDIYQEVLKISENYFDALHLYGALLVQTQEFLKAAQYLSKAININPYHAISHSNHGNALQGLKRYDEALLSYDKAISIKPDFFQAYFNRGVAFKKMYLFDKALLSLDKAIFLNPNYAEAFLNRGLVLMELKRLDEAFMSFERAISIRPNYAEAYSNCGLVLKELDRLQDALVFYDKSLSINLQSAEIHSNRGVVLKELLRFDEAILSLNKAINLKPGFVEAHMNLGNVFKELLRLDDAIECYTKAMSIDSSSEELHWNLSLCYLLDGNFKIGWFEYEWRWNRKGFTSPKRNFIQPLWLGEKTLKDKTILLHAEQGLGDTIQFYRYVKLVSDLGARVILEVQRPLVKFLNKIPGVNQVLSYGDSLPAFDYHCPLLSLPLAFKTELNTIPIPLSSEEMGSELLLKWQAILGPRKNKKRVGLVWSGSLVHSNDKNRSLKLSALLPYLPSNVEYICLQKEIREIDKAYLNNQFQINYIGEQLEDFSDTAAVCKLMDLVVSVDTSVAHLSATLGIPTWLLLPFCPDWRWLLSRDDSPWYSSMVLFRQKKIGDWSGIFEKLKYRLEKFNTQEDFPKEN
jgi:hypothetical protein